MTVGEQGDWGYTSGSAFLLGRWDPFLIGHSVPRFLLIIGMPDLTPTCRRPFSLSLNSIRDSH